MPRDFQVPESWPKWKKRCEAKLSNRERHCKSWAVTGMPTCKFHGSGGKRNRELGQLRYLCWIITGGPQDMPVEMAARIALFTYAEAVLNNRIGTVDQQLKAALWITGMLDE